jgi:hydroxymethylbilane synthase
MTEGACDAVVLAVAGLRRLGIGSLASGGPDRFAFGAAEVTATILDPDAMMPAPAQGALALETRAEDRVAAEIASALQCPAAERATAAERAFLEALGGGCRTPIGALGEPDGGEIRLRGIVASPNGSRVLRGEMRGPMQEAERLGADLARQLTEEGAAELLAQIS